MSSLISQFSLFGQPVPRGEVNLPAPTARHTDPATSHAAAQDASLSASQGRLLALRTLAAHPAGLTDFDLADLTGWQQTSIGKRRGECVKAGLVVAAYYLGPDGEPHLVKRTAPSGSQAIVWRITDAGRDYLKDHDHA